MSAASSCVQFDETILSKFTPNIWVREIFLQKFENQPLYFGKKTKYQFLTFIKKKLQKCFKICVKSRTWDHGMFSIINIGYDIFCLEKNTWISGMCLQDSIGIMNIQIMTLSTEQPTLDSKVARFFFYHPKNLHTYSPSNNIHYRKNRYQKLSHDFSQVSICIKFVTIGQASEGG